MLPNRPHSDYAFYNGRRWRNYSKRYRQLNSCCEVCNGEGRTTGVTLSYSHDLKRNVSDGVTDHVVPISKGGAVWDDSNHMAMCHHHHNRKRAYEQRGYVVDAVQGIDGLVPDDRAAIIDKLLLIEQVAERGADWIDSDRVRPGHD